MNREEAILNAVEIANILDKRGLNGAANSLSESLKVLCTPRNPWVKTSDRLPTAADADNTMYWVLATTISSNLPMPEPIGYIRANPDRYPYWMPFPPLPEVEG